MAMHAYIRNLATQTFATMNLHGKISPAYKTTTVETTTAAEIYANNYVITTVVLDLLSFQIFVVV